MRFIADFHIHSSYSRATSNLLKPENLDLHARLKGIKVVGTGDFTHPEWVKKLKEKLIEKEPGLYSLKEEYKIKSSLIEGRDEIRFLLTSEISLIYKKKDKVRKIHILLFAPNFEIVEKIQKKFEQLKFNIKSDGRPILGIDAKAILEILLNISENILFVPAHIWTPWFSLLGDKSGFDSIEECFEDMSKYIYALETGLSSDLPMNWLCSFLDNCLFLSNSDAHSPEMLGRNANIFNCDLNYFEIINVIKNRDYNKFIGTIDLFPQEGKYHFDGHRKCNIRYNPLQTVKNSYLCPVCNKKLTVGVMHRVAELSDRADYKDRKEKSNFYYIIPLKEILSNIYKKGESSKIVIDEYNRLISSGATEFDILLNYDLGKIESLGNEKLYYAIKKMREGDVHIEEGYDGEFGRIYLFNDEELNEIKNKSTLFDFKEKEESEIKWYAKYMPIDFDIKEFKEEKKRYNEKQIKSERQNFLETENIEQKRAIEYLQGNLLILAGPGTGKTYTITQKIFNIIQKNEMQPEEILVITFSNRAKDELKERLLNLLKQEQGFPFVETFHSFGYLIIRENISLFDRKENFIIIDDNDKEKILEAIGIKKRYYKKVIEGISNVKNNFKKEEDIKDINARKIFNEYENFLKTNNLFDLDDLLYKPMLVFNNNKDFLDSYKKKFKYIFIDEYQDINYIQYSLIKMLASDNCPICSIGDPDQAIYGFRGASNKFINQFQSDYKDAITLNLTKNYRSSQYILDSGCGILQKEKNLIANFKGDKIKIIKYSTHLSEAEGIARTIQNLIGGTTFFSIDSNVIKEEQKENIGFKDIAILCRIKEQFKPFIEAFHNHNIPYQIVDKDTIFENKIVNNILNILKYSYSQNEFIKNILKINGINITIDFINILNQEEDIVKKIELIIKEIFHNNINEQLKEKLLNYCSNKKVEELIQKSALDSDTDFVNTKIESVKLMTLHSSKGLEFEAVFIPGCEDGLLPFSIFDDYKGDIEEEKRLFYVGMTRAKRYLYLSYTKSRVMYGKEYKLKMSRFLSIEKSLYEEKKEDLDKKKFEKSLFDL